MTLEDGRVVPAFVAQALRGEPLTVYGDGRQTRSFCFIDDLVDGLLALWDRGDARPVNLGNPDEFTILAFAAAVLRATGSTVPLAHRPLPTDDPRQRQPDIARARTLLGWEPRIDLEEGLARTVASFRPRVQAGGDGGCAG
jgi:nucleoside-diphosphate-sugar epimerase